MRRYALGLFAAGLLLTGLARGDEDAMDPLARVQSHWTMEFALYSEFPPYSYEEKTGGPQGIDVDVARAIAKRLGVSAKIRLFEAQDDVGDDLRNVVWKGHYLAGGVSDAMLHVAFDAAYAKKEDHAILFRPYFHDSVCVIYKPGAIKNFESPMALTGHRVAVQGDTISDFIVSSAFNGALRTSAVRNITIEQALEAFKAGDADAVMAPRGELTGIMKLAGMDIASYESHDLIGMFRTQWDVGIAIKNEDDKPSLRDAISGAMDAMEKDGELAGIFAAHGVQYIPPAGSPSSGPPKATAP